jgi:putative ABC transport system permease protein
MSDEPSNDVERELAFHVDMRIRELIEQGVPPERARELALRRFGDYDDSRAACLEIDARQGRRMTRIEFWREWRQDIGYALRMGRRAPGFAVVAVLTLALGVGANSAIFSVVHGVLLKSLPYSDADRLYRIRTLYPDGTPYSLSAPDFASIRQDTTALDGVEAYAQSVYTLLGAGEAREIIGARVSDGLFAMLGFRTVAGRMFGRDAHQPGRDGVVVLHHGFWQRQFSGDPAVVGRTLSLAGRPYTVVGVLAAGAKLPIDADVFVPVVYDQSFGADDSSNLRRSEFLAVVGRARPGADAAAVEQDLRRIGSTLQERFPRTNARLTFAGVPLAELIVGDVRTPLLMLLGAVGFVLLVACANVANLLLARATARRQEMALRAALGASRGRLMRQLVTESAVLGLVGAAVGLGLAWAGTRALVAAQPADIPRLEEVGVDTTVVGFALLVSLVTSVVFGLLPAFHATGRSLTQTWREGDRSGGAGRAGHRMRAVLVVAEMALAVMLLIGAGLLIRSFAAMTRVPNGFQPDRLLTFRTALQGPAYADGAAIRQRAPEMEERLRRLPGVTGVALATLLPLSGRGSVIDFAVEGAPPPPADVNREIATASVTAGYFDVIGAPLVHGRSFTNADVDGAPLVAVVNEAAVRRWFDGQDPIGRFVLMSGNRLQVVGVVADVQQRDPRTPTAPQLFAPYAQRTTRSVRVVVRTAGDPLAVAPAIRSALREFDPDLAISSLAPGRDLVDNAVARPRLYTTLLALFAAVALALAATGVFGVMNYAVAQRSREISIRMALGARAASILRMVIGRAVLLAAIGVTVGMAAAFALGRVIEGQLFGVTMMDPVTLGAVVAVLVGSAVVASALPARRAATIDPGSVLR